MAHVHQINVSKGGVPKLPVDQAYVDIDGMEGDNQADRQHHGGPRQTLCLYSADVIEELRAQGHPIAPGYAGENITFAGVNWQSLESGDRFEIGPDLVIALTDPATPCSKNAAWFKDGNFRRMSHTDHPGFSRWYAVVTTPGLVSAGDEIRKIGTSQTSSGERNSTVRRQARSKLSASKLSPSRSPKPWRAPG